MRLIRVAAFTVWAVVALLAIAGFAEFSPETPMEGRESSAEATTTVQIRSDWGSLAGRVAAMAFTTGMKTSVTEAPVSETLGSELQALPEEPPPPEPVVVTTSRPPSTTTTTEPTTTTTTTRPPTTTTTTRPPTTTTTAAPTTTTTTPDTTTTTAPDTTTTTVFRSSVEQWRSLVEAYFQPDDVNRALSVIECESGGNPNAVSGSGLFHGLFQQSSVYWDARAEAAGWPGADIYDPEANIAVSAYLVYRGGGWSHWSSCL